MKKKEGTKGFEGHLEIGRKLIHWGSGGHEGHWRHTSERGIGKFGLQKTSRT